VKLARLLYLVFGTTARYRAARETIPYVSLVTTNSNHPARRRTCRGRIPRRADPARPAAVATPKKPIARSRAGLRAGSYCDRRN